MKRVVTGILAAAFAVSVFGGCGEKNTGSTAKIDESQFFDFSQYKDSNDVPDWTGDKLCLTKWVSANAPNAGLKKQNRPDTDVVSPEIERITGISFNVDESFDNAGGSFDAKVAQMIAAKSFPQIAEGVPELSNLIGINALWKLDELIPKYAPTLYKTIGPDSPVYGEFWQDQIDNYGGVYELPCGGLSALREMKKAGISDLTDEQLTSILGPGPSPYPSVYIRDDILKKLYPEAKTQDELEALFEKNGKLTLEEMLDVPINSPKEFEEMLYKIRDMHLMDGANEIYPIYTHTGSDNWPVLSVLSGMFGYSCDYFSYYDKIDHTVKYTFKEDWFKEMLRTYNKWIRDGVASKEALLDTNAIFNEKLNNGRYVVVYGTNIKNENIVGDFKYRTVYPRYKMDSDKFLTTTYNYIGTKWTLFKSQLNEAQVAQILRYFDFSVSDAGCKLNIWGPKNAGLYDEDDNGQLKYKDATLAKEMAVGVGELAQSYGLGAGTWPGRYVFSPTKYTPRAFYNGEQSLSIAFNPAFYEKLEQTKSNGAAIYSTAATAAIPELNTFWQSRKNFEDALLKTFASKSDSEFESNYKTVVDLAEKNGLTDETLEKYNKLFREKINKNYMKNLE